MKEFVSIVLSMPTIVFTGLLAISVSFWLVSLATGTDSDLDADTDLELDGAGGFLTALDLHLMPISLVFTVVSLVGWITSFVLVYLLHPSALFTVPVGFLALGAGILAAGRVGRLSAPLFDVTPAIKQDSLLGRSCVVRTQRVDGGFGQAEVIDAEKSSHIVQVRCPDPNSLTAGSTALLVDLDDGIFTVAEGLIEF